MKHILVDVDDTILEYTKSLLKYANIPYPNVDKIYTDICDYLVTEHGYTYDEVQGLIVDFNHSPSFRYIEPLKGADKIIEKLKNDNVTIDVITSCGDSQKIKDLRYQNLREVFGDVFRKIHILPLMSRKINALLPYINDDVIFVEDTLIHYNDANLLGIDSYIIKGQMNKLAHDENVNSFDHWEDFYRIYNSNHK